MNSMIRKFIFLKIFSITLVCFLSIIVGGCNITKVVRGTMIPMYDGVLRFSDEVAVIKWDSRVYLKEIRKDSVVLPARWKLQPCSEIHILPGAYKIKYEYRDSVYRIPKKNDAVEFDALPGHIYEITARVETIHFRGGKVRIMMWYPEVKDITLL